MKIIAHRGLRTTWKENTKEAILEALQTSFIDGVEFDVRFTKDQKLVIIHNMTIDRVSNGSGFVHLKTLKELRTLNFGTKQHPSTIATLKEVLENVPNQKIIMIELKQESDVFEDLIHVFRKEIKPYRHLNLYVCSFNYALIQSLKRQDPSLICGLLVGPFFNQAKEKKEFDFLSYESHLELPKTNQELFVWTVNQKKTFAHITGIITDKPSLYG